MTFGLWLWPPAARSQQPIIIRLAHSTFPGGLYDIVATRFAKEANQALQGRVEVRLFHSGQLGSDEQMIKGIKVGAPEMFIPSRS